MASTMQTYRGNCHCGAFVYEAKLPEIKQAHGCNCSICHKKGYLWVFAGPKEDFKIVKGSDDELTKYTFGSGKMLHKFCPKCATPLMGFHDEGEPGKQHGLNVHAMQGVNTWKLETLMYNGARLPSDYKAPEYKGKEPEKVEGKELYTGTCHCGKVGVAVMSKPLDRTSDEKVVECDCSICERNAYRWIYPPVEAVVLTGDEADIGRYAMAKCRADKTFCKTCGVCMTNQLHDDTLKTMEKPVHPVNLRVLDKVDPSVLELVQKEETAKTWEPQYQNP